MWKADEPDTAAPQDRNATILRCCGVWFHLLKSWHIIEKAGDCGMHAMSEISAGYLSIRRGRRTQLDHISNVARISCQTSRSPGNAK